MERVGEMVCEEKTEMKSKEILSKWREVAMKKCGETEKEAGLIPADPLIVKLLYNIHVVSGDSESFFLYIFFLKCLDQRIHMAIYLCFNTYTD